MRQRFFQALCAPLAALMFVVSGPLPSAQAAMVPTDQIVRAAPQFDASADRERLAAFMAREDVRTQMQSMGVSPDEVNARLAALSDTEIAKLAGKMDSALAGGSFLGTLVGIVLIVAIVLLITDLLGLTDVYPIGPAR